MNQALKKLSKYIRLEAQRGFDDRAVVGGMLGMLEPWSAEARQSGLPQSVIDTVESRLGEYPHMSPPSRRQALADLWRQLEAELPDLPPISELSEGDPSQAPGEAPDGSPGSSPHKEERPVQPAFEGDQSDAPPQMEKQPQSKADDAEPEGTPEHGSTDAQADSDRQPKPAAAGPATEGPPDTSREQSQPASKDMHPTALVAPLTTLSGIGPKSAKTLKKLGLETLGDLLWHLPRRYDDYSKLKTINRLWYGDEVTIIATVEEVGVRPVRSGKMKLTEATVSDGTGSLRITWFNQPWIADRLKPGQPVVLSAKVDQYLGRLTMSNPEWEMLDRQQLHTNRIVPVYPLTAGVTAKWLRRVMHSVAHRLAPRVPDPLPESLRRSADLMPLSDALLQVHFPDSWETLERAQHRLAFDEMFQLQLGVLRHKREWEALETEPLRVDEDWMQAFLSALPFELTTPQRRAMNDVRQDLASSQPMNRLLEGDVGSGKTVVAAGAIAICAHNEGQSALMAPTSILAEQHYRTLLEILPASSGMPAESLRLLIGDTPEAEKSEIRQLLAGGEIRAVIGTHALLEDPVDFHNLRLAIIDEQHRFGVEQRSLLRSKGDNPNLLVMTATPIPRSLALTIYGDLDLSIIDELPPGRKPIETRVLTPIERSRAYNFILGQLEQGGQAFIIYPLVEESDKLEAKAAVEEYERLQREVFYDRRVALLHGRMKAEEKDKVMSAFRRGEYDVLVSTSVVEVGVDVPKATVMLIEGANQFGLAQLHQLRGRVGRGGEKAYCLLVPDSEDNAANERLKAMEATTNGFELAELDLNQRGPGDFLGTRQSGFAEMKLARLTDVRLIEKARREARALFERDPDFSRPEHELLAEAVDSFWSDGRGEIS